MTSPAPNLTDTIATYGPALAPDMLAKQVMPGFRSWAHTRLLCRSFAAAKLGGRNPMQIWTLDPQVGKTTAIKACVVWALDWWPDQNVIYWSYNDERGGEIGSDIRDVFEQAGTKLRTRLRADSTAKNRWRTDAGGGFISRTRFKGFPGHVVFVDDPFATVDEFGSHAHRERVWRRWQSDVVDRFAEGVVVVVVMTRGHRDDLVGKIKTQNPEMWHHIHIPAIADPAIVDPDPLGRAPGEPTCRARHTAESRLQTKAMVDPWIWSTVYQGVPSAPEGRKFLRDYWRYLDAGIPPERRVVTISSWDLTFGDTGGSWVVGQKWILDGQGRFCCVDQIRDKADFDGQRRMFRRFAERHPDVQFDLIENKANGPALISELAHAEWYRTAARQVVPVAVPPGAGKLLRAEANLPLFADGRVWLPGPGVYTAETEGSDHGWIEDLIDEHALFPSDLNDQVDTASQALTWLRSHDPKRGPGLQAASYRR